MSAIDASEFWGAASSSGTLWGDSPQPEGRDSIPLVAENEKKPAFVEGWKSDQARGETDHFLIDLQKQLQAVMHQSGGGALPTNLPEHRHQQQQQHIGGGGGNNVWSVPSEPVASYQVLNLQQGILQGIPQLQPLGTSASSIGGSFSVVGGPASSSSQQQQQQQQQAGATIITPPGMTMYLVPGTNQIVMLPIAATHGGSPAPQGLPASQVSTGFSATSSGGVLGFPSMPTSAGSTPGSMFAYQHATASPQQQPTRRQRNSRGQRGNPSISPAASIPMFHPFPPAASTPLHLHSSMMGGEGANDLAPDMPQHIHSTTPKLASGGLSSSFTNNSTSNSLASPFPPQVQQTRELGNRPNHNTNVHDSLAGKCSFHAYRSGSLCGSVVAAARRPPKLLPPTPTNRDLSLPIFVQMFPSEWIQQAQAIFQELVRTICGPTMPAVVETMDMRSETSFIAVVRTAHVWDLIARLRCRVLMDRHGYWYANDWKAYLDMKEYCEAVRRLPQQQRHCKTDGLPCMPLVVELGRSATMDSITAPYCAPFDSLIQAEGSPTSTTTASGSDAAMGQSTGGSSFPSSHHFGSPPSAAAHHHGRSSAGGGRRSQRGSGPHHHGFNPHHHHHNSNVVPPMHPNQQQFYFHLNTNDPSSLHVLNHQQIIFMDHASNAQQQQQLSSTIQSGHRSAQRFSHAYSPPST